MRKHSVRKWLHAVLDLLPVLILPVFAIYEINHDHNEPISVDVSENVVADFNQQVHNGNFTNNYYWTNNSSGSATSTIEDNTYIQTFTRTPTYSYNSGIVQYFTNSGGTQLITNHKYYLRCEFQSNQSDLNFQCMVTYYGTSVRTIASDSSYQTYEYLYTANTANHNIIILYVNNSTSINADTYIKYRNINLFDFTQMFGAGNEPSIETFNQYFSDNYYDYTVSQKSLIKDYSSVTYADTDVGSQMIYSLYKPVVNYFNFNNVFNFGAIYDWFQLNMFNGNAPMVAFIVWNIIVYEFIMDILFLVYSVFMFVIDFASDTLERFTGWSRKGS